MTGSPPRSRRGMTKPKRQQPQLEFPMFQGLDPDAHQASAHRRSIEHRTQMEVRLVLQVRARMVLLHYRRQHSRSFFRSPCKNYLCYRSVDKLAYSFLTRCCSGVASDLVRLKIINLSAEGKPFDNSAPAKIIRTTEDGKFILLSVYVVLVGSSNLHVWLIALVLP